MAEKVEENKGYSYIVSNDSYLTEEPWWAILIAGILGLAFGIIIIAWPHAILGFLIIFFGVLALLGGAIGVIGSLFLIKKDKNWWIMLIEGILGIIIGVLVFVWPIGSTVFLVYFIAAWLIITGIAAIAYGSTSKDTIRIVVGVTGLILGIFVLFRPPFYATTTLLLFIGFFAVFRGIALIITSIVRAVSKRRAKKVGTQAAK